MSQKEELPEGYEIPIHRSLVKPLYWMGVPRNLFYCRNLVCGIRRDLHENMDRTFCGSSSPLFIPPFGATRPAVPSGVLAGKKS